MPNDDAQGQAPNAWARRPPLLDAGGAGRAIAALLTQVKALSFAAWLGLMSRSSSRNPSADGTCTCGAPVPGRSRKRTGHSNGAPESRAKSTLRSLTRATATRPDGISGEQECRHFLAVVR